MNVVWYLITQGLNAYRKLLNVGFVLLALFYFAHGDIPFTLLSLAGPVAMFILWPRDGRG